MLYQPWGIESDELHGVKGNGACATTTRGAGWASPTPVLHIDSLAAWLTTSRYLNVFARVRCGSSSRRSASTQHCSRRSGQRIASKSARRLVLSGSREASLNWERQGDNQWAWITYHGKGQGYHRENWRASAGGVASSGQNG